MVNEQELIFFKTYGQVLNWTYEFELRCMEKKIPLCVDPQVPLVIKNHYLPAPHPPTP